MLFKEYAKNLLQKEINAEPVPPRFNDGKPLTSRPRNYYIPEESQEAELVIGDGVDCEGIISWSDHAEINGRFEGSVQSSGSLHVGKSGLVIADLNLNEVTIAGRVEGNLIIQGRCTLLPGAHVEGNIKAGQFSVGRGATINGKIEILPKEKAVELKVAQA